jgi:hypothetical protein
VIINGSLTTGANGLTLSASNSVIKGLVVNGFANGIALGSSNIQNNVISDNYVGTDATGTTAVPNQDSGISVATTHNTDITRNLISGNGVGIITCDASTNFFTDNLIGTDRTGTNNLANTSHGIYTLCSTGSGNTYQGNTIAFNGGDGLRDQPDYNFGLNGHIKNQITQNSFFSNTGLGINLLPPPVGTIDGVTPNDTNDPDEGGNHLQNFPVISSATVTGSTRNITGTLNSAANTQYRIEYFSSASCNAASPNDYGEGQTYLGAQDVTTVGNDVSFTFHPTTLIAGQFITATATDPLGNTSEFSQCVAVNAGTAGQIQFTTSSYSVGEGDGMAHVIVQRTGGSDGSISATFNTSDGTATVADNDYTGVNNMTVTFADGITATQMIDIPITNDNVYENNETVNLSLSSTNINAPGGSPLTAVLTINNNDAPPTLAIDNVTMNEGNSGTTNFVFTVTKTGATALNATVSYATMNGTAQAGPDYTTNSNSLTFLPADSTKQITVQANGDTSIEGNETFFVNLSSPADASLTNALGLGTLDNDDGPTGRLAFAKFSFDTDNKADISTWRGSNGDWHVINSTTGLETIQYDWGKTSLGDVIVPADYDGDGRTDFAVFRKSEGNWYIVQSTTGTPVIKNWGGTGDLPVPGDYDGDNRADVAVWRESEGNWYILNSRTNTGTLRGWGAMGDQPVLGDFDGDRMTDIAVYRASEGNWYIINSSTNTVTRQNWGAGSDRPVPGDYDGDGLTDIAVFRAAGDWYIRKSTGGVTIKNWGNSDDQPVPGDYNGDGQTDIAVWRPTEGTWYVLNSGTNTSSNYYLGLPSDLPVPGAFVP